MGENKMNIKEINRQVLDRRTETLKKIYNFNLLIGFLMASFAIVLLALFVLFTPTESWEIFIVVVGSTVDGIYSVIGFINAFKNKKMLNSMYSANPDETEEKELFCYKFSYISILRGGSAPRSGRRCAYAVSVSTVHGKFYYVFQKEFDHNILSAHCRDLHSGEHKFEVYKGTNIIKNFSALEKLIRGIPKELLDY